VSVNLLFVVAVVVVVTDVVAVVVVVACLLWLTYAQFVRFDVVSTLVFMGAADPKVRLQLK